MFIALITPNKSAPEERHVRTRAWIAILTERISCRTMFYKHVAPPERKEASRQRASR
jgi:hypothetical protein